MSIRTVEFWFRRFRVGDESVEDKEHTGRPSHVDNELLESLIEKDPRKSTRELSKDLTIDHVTVLRHLQEIGKVKKLDKWVPHEWNDFQKTRRFEICSSLLLRHESDPFIDRIVTCDEKWIFYDNRRRSAQWLDKDEAPQQFPKPKLTQKKTLVTVWWSTAGVIHYDFLKRGETIHSDKYCLEITKMHETLSHKCPGLVHRKGPLLLHDNARPHGSQTTIRKLHDLGYETLPHPPYSPDLSPTDFHLFKHFDAFLKDKIFGNQTDAENAFSEFIESKPLEFFRDGMSRLVGRWQSDGNYFDSFNSLFLGYFLLGI